MSLLDALLLDPYPFDIWIAYRGDGLKGSGTLNDPYDGSTPARFDSILSGLGANTRVHLGPGTFQTKGYSDEITPAWQIKAGMKIVGSGIDVTTLRLADAQTGGTSARLFAIGHALTAGDPQYANLVDFAEVSDLTIDCNLGGQAGTQVACGGVRLMGNHTRVSRVKVKSWGTKIPANACYAIGVVTGDRSAGLTEVMDTGIEGCLAVEPSGSDVGPSAALHAGAKEEATNNAEAYGKGPYIRNCYVDCGSPTATPEYRALSMGWCRGGIVEGNQVHNTKYGGPYHAKCSIRDLVVRNNYYRNVARGPFWYFTAFSEITPAATNPLVRDSGDHTVALATTDGAHNLQAGERVKMNASGGPSQFNGTFVIKDLPSANQFRYQMTSDPGGNAQGTVTMQKVIGLRNVLVELNVIELAWGSTGEVAIHLKDYGAGSTGQAPDYYHGEVILRGNKIRYVDGAFDSSYSGLGIEIDSAKNVIVAENVIECAPTNPIRDFRCGTATYFHNDTPAGALIQGYNGVNFTKYSELETEAEDALLLNLT